MDAQQHPEVPSESELNKLVEIVKQKISDDEHNFALLPRMDVPFLTKFIRAKKYRAEEAAVAIRNYYAFVYQNLRLIEGIKSQDSSATYNLGCVGILKQRFNGSTLIYSTMSKWDTEVASFMEVVVACAFVLEELFQDPEYQKHGFHWILDYSGFGLSHMRQMTYSGIKFGIKVVLQAFPARVGGIHLTNMPTIAWPVYKLIMKLMPKKIQSRLHIHTDFESLKKFIPSEVLPVSLSGEVDEEEAWDNGVLQKLMHQNICYDSYWKAGHGIRRPRRLTRKRSSSMRMSCEEDAANSSVPHSRRKQDKSADNENSYD